MGLRLKLKLEGEGAVRRALGNLAGEPGRRARARALERCAELVRDRTRRDTLSGQVLGVVTGELRDSILVDPTHLPRWVEIGSELDQAPPLHFGWRAHNLPPRPFLERGLELAEPRFPSIWAEELEAAARAGA
jgi:hypothetical protein